jgi:hypothetical protein
MKKNKFLLVILFFGIIWTWNTNDALAGYSCENGSGNTPEQCAKSGGTWKYKLDWWLEWWQFIENQLFRNMTIKDYFTKDFTVQLEDTSNQFTDYKSTKKDTSFRILPEKVKEKLKGVWFYEVITAASIKDKKKYKNEYDFEIPNDCPQINKISDIVWYFYNKGEKILYSPESPNQPVDYPSDINNFDTPPLDSNFDHCYEFAYKNIQPIPQGQFLPDENWKPGDNYYIDAAVASIQNNKSLSFTLPQNTQDQLGSCPTTTNTKEEVEVVMRNSKLKELAMNRFQISKKGQDTIGIDDSIYKEVDKEYTKDPNEPENILRNTARLWLTPQKWQDQKTTTANNDSKETNLTMIYRQKTTTNKPKETNLNIVYNN